MIFGGLEIVAGGYLIHRHYRKKNQANTAENDAQQKRHHTFPGAICSKQQQQQQQHYYQQHTIQHPSQPPQHHQPALPNQKYACYAIAPQPRPQLYTPQTLPPQDFQHHQHAPPLPAHQRPQLPPQPHSFTIPRRPVPERKPQIIIQPSLQRTDSFATLSRMPIANGYRPHDVREEEPIQPASAGGHGGHGVGGGVYSNAGYSMSTPAFGATATSPGLTYEMATAEDVEGWERYGYRREGEHDRPHYAPTVSTELGERDVAPPPYVP
ncbi:hypothetical protein COCMIDRAFT_97111 [Bipolaris oryzae ATCC 44560]|uniref:Uncharacterized protein n=1 Tax=Bipolaris oryzae ATCC 44560 TaxID=930090 RepID=W6Z509_COCMI|nr:uncharacterized protein COCMIDRAFT_97111 [Bipolaris oryzae ATCC 44560]EUC44843.1 hypothetical protein COCMIDRAFT_97111 [Bipolaris oryzae ATCC 44560]